MSLYEHLPLILISYFIFIFVIVVFQSMGMPILLNHTPAPPTVPSGTPDILTYLTYIFNYVPYFFTLMLVSTTSSLLGAIIFIPFDLILLLEILHLIRGG